MLIVGHAPQELIDIVGYNPVIELDIQHPRQQIQEIARRIADYQPLVDKNRVVALKLGDWKQRMQQMMVSLEECGYRIRSQKLCCRSDL